MMSFPSCLQQVAVPTFSTWCAQVWSLKKILHQQTNDKKLQKAIWAEDWISAKTFDSRFIGFQLIRQDFQLLAGFILRWSEGIWIVHLKPIGCFLRVYIGVGEKGEYLSC